jgi:predicted nucleic acid-binding protein
MILVDTSVWIDFFRGRPAASTLTDHLDQDRVLVHPWVRGELALGSLGRRRSAVLADLARLPPAPMVTESEVLAMIDARRLSGSGIGWVDAQLLASALVTGAALWTRDRRLASVAAECGPRI